MTAKPGRDGLDKKAVQDNIVESWLCIDCGVNTHPGCPDGPMTRIEIALYGGSKFVFDCETEVYEVRDAIWKDAGMVGWGGCLCIGCLEQRLGRKLRPRDFAVGDKLWAAQPSTERLLNRRGSATVTIHTKDGPKEVICRIEQAPLIDGKFVEEGDPK